MERAEIEQRLDAVGELAQQTILRAELRKQLGGILDIERLLAKVTLGSAGPRDPLAVAFAARLFGKATLGMALLPVGLLLHVGYVTAATVAAAAVLRGRLSARAPRVASGGDPAGRGRGPDDEPAASGRDAPAVP